MFEFMFTILFVQESTWYLLVSQNGNNHISAGMTIGIKGIRDIYLLASPTNGVQFYIRDLFVSNGSEYNKDNLLINSNEFFNHACDTYTGVDIQFAASIFYEWPSNTVYTFGADLDHTAMFDQTLSSVHGMKLPHGTLPAQWDLEFDMKPSITSDYFYIMGVMMNNGTTYLQFYHDFRFSPIRSTVYAAGGGTVQWNESYPTGTFTNVKMQVRNTGIEVYINNVLEATFPASSYTAANLQLIAMGTYGGIWNMFQGEMKNVKITPV